MTESKLESHQIQLEKLFNKNQLIPRVKSEFIDCKDVDFIAWFKEAGIPSGFGFDLLAQMALHKRAKLPVLVGLLRHHFNDSQATVDALLQAAIADIVDWSPATQQFIVRITISQDVQEELDRFQYPLPMVIKPKTVRKNTDTGYLISKGSLILKNNHHNEDICLDHINRMNQVKLTIDNTVATMVANSWRDLDKPKEGETKEDFEKRKRAFDKYDRTCKDVMELVNQEGNTFFLTHRYDKRGRVYCQGYHVTYQGNAWNKAVIALADKELVNED